MTRRRQFLGVLAATSVAGCSNIAGDVFGDQSSEPSSASTPEADSIDRVVEDFESGDLSGYTGDRSGFRISEERAAHGSRSLRATNPSSDPYELIGRESLDAPSAGETFRFEVNLGSEDFGEGVGFTLYFGYQGPERHHNVKVDRGEDWLELADSTGVSARADVRPPLDAWLTIEVDWKFEDMTTARLIHEEEVIAATSLELSSPTSGTIGWRPQDARGKDRWVDYLRVVGTGD